MTRPKLSMFDRTLLGPAMLAALRKLDPLVQWRNPVMFVVYIGSILTTILWLNALTGHGEAPAWFILNVAIWLWFTVLFANFAEALAEGRSKAQAALFAVSSRRSGPRSSSMRVIARVTRAYERMNCGAAMWSSWKPATMFRRTAK